MAKILDIVNGISQVLSNTHDGALDEDGEPIKIGLRREEGNPIIDSRVIDGFSARFQGDRLIVSYQYDCKLQHVHSNGFESEVDSTVNDVVKFIKKEFKKLTGNSLSLKEEGEIDVLVQYISRVRTTVTAQKTYRIGGEPLRGQDGAKDGSKDRLDSTIKKFLELGPGQKRPSNDKSKSDNYKQFEPWNLQTGPRNTNIK
jgi:hypothetical protein